MMANEKFRLGVNYWPASKAMRFWQNWSEPELSEDFSKMKAAGLDSVRIFLTWEDFQKNPSVVDSHMLARLGRTMDRAAEAGLMVMPTLFTGHMSGANWLPAWTLGPQAPASRFRIVSGGEVTRADPKNWYADRALQHAQVTLASECAAALRGHEALLAWDLGNENSNCVVPDTKDRARGWLAALTGAIRKSDPGALVTVGLHMEDLEEDRQLGPAEAAEACDFLTMHGYPGYAPWTDGPTDERLLPFLVQLTRFLGGGKEVFFTEFGVPTRADSSVASDPLPEGRDSGPALVSEEEAAAYIARSLNAIHESGAMGAMMWCYSDYATKLFDSPPLDQAPHERTFGLFRQDGSEKPTVSEVRAFSAEKRAVAASARVAEAGFFEDVHDYYLSPGANLPQLFGKYCEALARTAK